MICYMSFIILLTGIMELNNGMKTYFGIWSFVTVLFSSILIFLVRVFNVLSMLFWMAKILNEGLTLLSITVLRFYFHKFIPPLCIHDFLSYYNSQLLTFSASFGNFRVCTCSLIMASSPLTNSSLCTSFKHYMHVYVIHVLLCLQLAPWNWKQVCAFHQASFMI